MENKETIILNGSTWSKKELLKFETIYLGKYNGAEFPTNKIVNYDRVFSPFHFSLTRHFPDGVTNEDCDNPYLPEDEDCYYVSLVTKDERYGLIDSYGNVIIPPIYQVLHCANETWMPYFVAKKEDGAFIFDVLRKKVISDIYDDIKVVAQHHPASRSTDGYFKSYKNGKCGLVHETGKQILPPIFDDCFGLCWAGKESCNPEYRFAIVTINDKKGLYNELGNEVLPIKYDSMRFAHPDSFNAKNIRVRGKIGDEKEIDLIEYESAEKGLFGNKRNRKNSFFSDRPTFGRYAGSYAQDEMGYSDDDIDTIFDGDPSAYWNID